MVLLGAALGLQQNRCDPVAGENWSRSSSFAGMSPGCKPPAVRIVPKVDGVAMLVSGLSKAGVLVSFETSTRASTLSRRG